VVKALLIGVRGEDDRFGIRYLTAAEAVKGALAEQPSAVFIDAHINRIEQIRVNAAGNGVGRDYGYIVLCRDTAKDDSNSCFRLQ
jgi:hypothetical protein